MLICETTECHDGVLAPNETNGDRPHRNPDHARRLELNRQLFREGRLSRSDEPNQETKTTAHDELCDLRAEMWLADHGRRKLAA